MKCIIAGSRDITDYRLVDLAVVQSGFDISTVVSGDARGVDQLGIDWAIQHHRDYVRYPANWFKHGRSAGYKRNVEMAQNADALIAIWDGKSRGTKHMIDTARQARLDVFVKTVKGD